MLSELFLFVVVLLLVSLFSIYKFKYAPIIAKTKDWASLPTFPITQADRDFGGNVFETDLGYFELGDFKYAFQKLAHQKKSVFLSACVIGSAHFFIGLSSDEILIHIYELVQRYAKNKGLKFWFGWELTFFVGHPNDMETIMTSSWCIEKSEQYNRLNDWLREGLLISKGKKWFQRRKLLTPAFHFSILKDYVEVSERQSRVFVEKLKNYAASGISFDIFHDGGLLALDVICETAMGVKINAQANANSEYVKAVKKLVKVTHLRMLDILHYYTIIHRLTKLHYKEEKSALSVVHSFSEKVIQQRRSELLKSKVDGILETEMEEIGIKRKMSFLDLLLQSHIDGNPLTDIDIREEVDTFMFEGHDTTSSAISFFFYNMAIHPGYQQKCFEEILNVFGKDKDKSATYDDLNKLHFIELCIKETLRLYPSVPMIGRKTGKDIVLHDGRIVPAGTNIGIMPMYVGRSEENFPDPNSFKPERFDVETSAAKISPFIFIPFSAGQRNCIGQKFALLELKTIILNVLRHFTVHYDGDRDKELLLTGELILRTKKPIMLRVKERRY